MEILKEQKLVYLTRREAELIQLKQSLSENSFEFAKMIGHRLKGHGETFGFPTISSIGIIIEKAAQEENMDMLSDAVQSLDKNIQENLLIFKQ